MASSNSAEQFCERHIGSQAVTACSQCGRKICRECIQEFGYFCSPECLEESRGNISEEDVQRRQQEAESLEAISRRTVYGLWMGAAIIILLFSWWMWASFIAAPGKPAWTWAPEEKTMQMEILSVDGKFVNVVANGNLYRIKAANGRQVQMIQLPNASGEAFVQVRTLPGKLSAASHSQAYAIDFSTGQVETTRFQKASSGGTFSADGKTLFLLHAQQQDYRTGEIRQPAAISCYALPGNGIPKWEIQAQDGYRFSKILEADGHLIVLEKTGSLYDESATCRLGVHDTRTGRRIWQLTFDQPLVWGPEVANGCIGIQAGDSFVAVGLDGTQKWAVDAPHGMMVSHVLTDTRAFLQKETGEECRDLNTGKRLWRCNSIFNGQFLVEKGAKLLASGHTSRVDAGGSPLMPGGDGMDDIMEDISGGTGGMLETLMSQPVLTAVNKDTGERLWRRENVVGIFFGDGARIVEISGVGSASLVQLFSGGGNRGTMVRQFSVRNGETLYTRSLDYSVDAYAIAGNRLVGVAYGMPKRHDASLLVGLRLK